LFLRVTLEADEVRSASRCARLRDVEAAMRIVAINAAHAFLRDAMVKRSRELLAHIAVALVAQCGDYVNQQVLGSLRLVSRVTVEASDPIQPMLALAKIVALFLLLVADQTAVVGDARRLAFGIENLLRITACLNVLLSRPVTGLAPFLRGFISGTGLRHQMSCRGVLLVDILMTLFAGFRSRV
jgi:hypothetical protein